MLDLGQGPAVVLIPGIQGRWEWMTPTVDALAKRCRVITFSLGPDPLRQIDDALDRAGLERAAVCGVSLGGVIALQYAATRRERTSGLVLVSTPGPEWTANRRQAFFAKHWLAASPLFAVNAVANLLPEISRARRGWWRVAAFLAVYGGRALRYPASPWRMKRRFDAWLTCPRAAFCSRITAPALIVTGERALDRAVPVEGTLQYADCFPSAARVAMIEHTGHIGLVTRPDRFAEIVAGFAEACA